MGIWSPPLPRTDKPRPLNRLQNSSPPFVPEKTKTRQTKTRSTETPPTFACFCCSVFGRLQPPSLGAENGKSREYAGIVLVFWVCAPGAVQNWHYIGKTQQSQNQRPNNFGILIFGLLVSSFIFDVTRCPHSCPKSPYESPKSYTISFYNSKSVVCIPGFSQQFCEMAVFAQCVTERMHSSSSCPYTCPYCIHVTWISLTHE